MNHRKVGLEQFATKFYEIQWPLLYEKTKGSLFVNSHNVWTFWLVVHLLFCEKIYRCGMCRASWVLRLLTPEQMVHRVAACNKLHTWFQREGEAEFSKVITVHESWLFHYVPKSKQLSSQWKTSMSPVPKKAEIMRSTGKVKMIIFFWWRGFSVSVHCIWQQHCYSGVLPRSLAKNDQSLKKKKKKTDLAKRLKKFFCIATMLAHMLHTPSPNFWRNEALELFHTLHIAQTLHHATSGYSHKLKKPCVGWSLSRISMWLKLWRRGIKSWVKMDYHFTYKSDRNGGSSLLH